MHSLYTQHQYEKEDASMRRLISTGSLHSKGMLDPKKSILR